MSKVADVKAFARELRPHIAAEIDRAEILKAMAKAARDKGIDWAQLKALVKAQELDARDGTDKRVVAIIEKADFAAAYADMLGFAPNMNNNGKSCSSIPIYQHAADPDTGFTAASGREVDRERDQSHGGNSDQNTQSIPPVSGSEKLRRQLQASIAMDAGPIPQVILDARAGRLS